MADNRYCHSDPLQQLAFITDNPARDSPVSEELSSALSDPAAFATCRERALALLASYQPHGPEDDTAAVLHIFLDRLPKEGQVALIGDITNSNNDSKLWTLRNHLVDAILKPMKLAGGKQPEPITEPTNAAAVDQINLSDLEPARREQGRIKSGCLERDGYRCLVTGSYDLPSKRERKMNPPAGAHTAFTQCAHILPFGLRRFKETDATETRNKAIIWFALHRYFPALRSKIDTASVNQFGNLMTLCLDAHVAVGEFSLAFWPTERDNVYKIRTLDETASILPSDGRVVEFISHDPIYPLPDRDLLEVHCRIAGILQVSGIGRMIERELEAFLDDPWNLKSDGSTDVGHILRRRMLMNVQAMTSLGLHDCAS